MYKLFYTNEYGQIVNADAVLEVNVSASQSYSESYGSFDSAKSIAEKFVKKNPAMACIISPGENGEDEFVVTYE